jgi:hypothetical protein
MRIAIFVALFASASVPTVACEQHQAHASRPMITSFLTESTAAQSTARQVDCNVDGSGCPTGTNSDACKTADGQACEK